MTEASKKLADAVARKNREAAQCGGDKRDEIEIESASEIAGYRFSDLKAARIVSNRTDLLKKQREHGFPRPVKLSERSAWWPASEIHAWLKARIAMREEATREKARKEHVA